MSPTCDGCQREVSTLAGETMKGVLQLTQHDPSRLYSAVVASMKKRVDKVAFPIHYSSLVFKQLDV